MSWSHLSACESDLDQQQRTPGIGSFPPKAAVLGEHKLVLTPHHNIPHIGPGVGKHPSSPILQFSSEQLRRASFLEGYK